MKYITITSKHHDGFAMFDSKVSDWDIVDRTPYRKDVLKALAEECRKQGIKLFFYYSQLDWHHPDYYPRGRTGNDAGRPDAGQLEQVHRLHERAAPELLTNYGEIGGIWFDGWWDRPDARWRLDETYELIHRLQPQALVGANHHKKPFDGEDFQMFEKDLPGHNTAGFNEDSQIGDAAARDVRHHQRRLGVQPAGPPAQEHARADPPARQGRRLQRQLPAQRRAHARREDPAGAPARG